MGYWFSFNSDYLFKLLLVRALTRPRASSHVSPIETLGRDYAPSFKRPDSCVPNNKNQLVLPAVTGSISFWNFNVRNRVKATGVLFAQTCPMGPSDTVYWAYFTFPSRTGMK